MKETLGSFGILTSISLPFVGVPNNSLIVIVTLNWVVLCIVFWKIVIFGDKSAAVTGGVTTIKEVTELQFVGLLTSHIL